jgi:hypothetical protein
MVPAKININSLSDDFNVLEFYIFVYRLFSDVITISVYRPILLKGSSRNSVARIVIRLRAKRSGFGIPA